MAKCFLCQKGFYPFCVQICNPSEGTAHLSLYSLWIPEHTAGQTAISLLFLGVHIPARSDISLFCGVFFEDTLHQLSEALQNF